MVAEQVSDGGLPLRSAKLIDTALGKVRRFLDPGCSTGSRRNRSCKR